MGSLGSGLLNPTTSDMGADDCWGGGGTPCIAACLAAPLTHDSPVRSTGSSRV